jgi:hypothetical protein
MKSMQLMVALFAFVLLTLPRAFALQPMTQTPKNPSNTGTWWTQTSAWTPAQMTPNLKVWLDGSDFSTFTLSYNATGKTGTGTAGNSTLTSNLTLVGIVPVGGQIMIAGDATVYTVTAIAGTTITVSPNLASTFAGAAISLAGVSQWSDKSGLGNHVTQATNSVNNQPPFTVSIANGNSAVTWVTGNNTQMLYCTICAPNLINGAHSIFMVTAGLTASANGAPLFNLWAGDGVPLTNSYFLNGASLFVSISRIGSSLAASTLSASSGTNLVGWSSTGLSGTSLTVTPWLNGASSTDLVQSSFRVNMTGFALGNYQYLITSAPGQVNGSVAEVIVVDQVLAANRRNEIEGYLAWKWAIQTKLPASHPYKFVPPRVTWDTVPTSFSFTDSLANSASSLVSSDIVQITGMQNTAAISITGSGSPQYRTCSDVTCTSVITNWTSVAGSIGASKYLQLRMTTPASVQPAIFSTVTVGSVSENWYVKTGPASPIVLTSGTSWSVPANWNSANNYVEIIGAGGNGAGGTATQGGGGGGGGAYAHKLNVTLTPSGSAAYSIAAGGSAADTYFNGANLAASSVGSKAGTNASGTTNGTGGSGASSVGDVKFSGGNGGSSIASGGGGGGGGSGGPLGAGANGGASQAASTGGNGGGGANNGVAGVNNVSGEISSTGGKGGTPNSTAGTCAATTSVAYNGYTGTLGGGGGGGSDSIGGAGGAGAASTEFDATHGAGGGGGGAGAIPISSGSAGGAGGAYGGGGGGGGDNGGGGSSAGGAGAGGIIVIWYLP